MEQVAAAGGYTGPVIESYTANTSSGSNAITLTKPTSPAVADDDLLILFASSATQSAFTVPTDWTVIQSGNALGHAVAACYKIADSTEGSTIDYDNGAADGKQGYYIHISGNHATTPMDVINTMVADGNASSFTVDEVASAAAQTLALAFLGGDGGDLYPYGLSGTGWTEEAEQQSGTGGSDASGVWGQKDMESSGGTADVTVTSSIGTEGTQHFQITIASA